MQSKQSPQQFVAAVNEDPSLCAQVVEHRKQDCFALLIGTRLKFHAKNRSVDPANRLQTDARATGEFFSSSPLPALPPSSVPIPAPAVII